jgi:hypothetical protein
MEKNIKLQKMINLQEGRLVIKKANKKRRTKNNKGEKLD